MSKVFLNFCNNPSGHLSGFANSVLPVLWPATQLTLLLSQGVHALPLSAFRFYWQCFLHLSESVLFALPLHSFRFPCQQYMHYQYLLLAILSVLACIYLSRCSLHYFYILFGFPYQQYMHYHYLLLEILSVLACTTSTFFLAFLTSSTCTTIICFWPSYQCLPALPLLAFCLPLNDRVHSCILPHFYLLSASFLLIDFHWVTFHWL